MKVWHRNLVHFLCMYALFHRVIGIWTEIRIEWEQTEKKQQQLKNWRKRTTRENKTYWLQILLQAQMKRKTLRAYKWNSGYYVLLNCCLFSMAFRFLFARGRYINNSWRLKLVWCVCEMVRVMCIHGLCIRYIYTGAVPLVHCVPHNPCHRLFAQLICILFHIQPHLFRKAFRCAVCCLNWVM